MRLIRIAIALIVAATAAIAAPALAQERIESFHSQIAIQKDGSLDVTETIRVKVENDRINHGIFRDIPTRYRLPNGGSMKVGFEFLDAALDDQPVDSKVEPKGNGLSIKLGSADAIVPIGSHTYRIHYLVTRELGFFKDYDELYWNVTGNGWVFPIDEASATITLPTAAPWGQRAVYTGAVGSTADNATVTSEEPGRISIATTAPLASFEGLTVAIAFPKGIVDEPSAGERARWFIIDMAPMVIAGLTLVAVIGFLLFAYRRAGRDPRPGTIVPLFSPPDDLSPSAMRYVIKQGLDNRAFAATLVDAGVKGRIRLVDESRLMGLSSARFIEGMSATGTAPLADGDEQAIAYLIQPGTRLELDNENHGIFSASQTLLREQYEKRFDGVAFKRNYDWVGYAVAIWVGGAFLTALAILFAEGAILPQLILIQGGLLLIAGLLWMFAARAGALGGCIARLIAFACLLVAGAGAMAMLPMALASGRWEPIVLVALGLPLALSSFFWISAPTKEGRVMLDRIAGFKQYLSITERERLDRMQAPQDSLTLFERFLPYAIALGVENRWADRFASQLAAASAAGAAGQTFSWYSGSSDPWLDTGGFVDSIGSSLATSISSASTAPGSSSGSGGGGSSGGGGGGGGGGGW